MSKSITQAEFKKKLAAARKTAKQNISNDRLKSDVAINYELRVEAVDKLTTVIKAVWDKLELDESRLEFTLKNARRSEYGRIAELSLLIARTYSWPIVQGGDISNIEGLQEEMLETIKLQGYNLSHDLLMDMKEAKGYHSMVAKDTGELVDGVEPDYDELHFLLNVFADTCGLPIMDCKVTETNWTKAESKTLNKIEKELEEIKIATENYEALQSA